MYDYDTELQKVLYQNVNYAKYKVKIKQNM